MPLPFPDLHTCGINLQAIFDLASLPPALVSALDEALGSTDIAVEDYSQALLFAHGGRALWQKVENLTGNPGDPVDDFSVESVSAVLTDDPLVEAFAFVYPGTDFSGLQKLGALAGWHHTSPLRIGINDTWGTWFAYRGLVLARSTLEPTLPLASVSPCDSCAVRSCMDACPEKAVTPENFNASACFSSRVLEGSPCAATCPARAACPAGASHAYSRKQMAYHYGISLEAIKRYNER